MTVWEKDAIRQVRAGDSGAFASLYRCYFNPIRRGVRRIVGDTESARDLTQDAFLAAYHHLDRFDEERSFYNWLYRIACNRAISQRRRQRFRGPLPFEEPPSPWPSPEDRFLARESAAGVRQALARLPAKYLRVLLLRYYHGCSYAEISRRLDLPTTTVRSRLHRARRLLAARLHGQ